MNDLELAVAAFTKMGRGEALSLADLERVWTIVLNNGDRVDSGNQDGIAQFVSQLKANLEKKYFS